MENIIHVRNEKEDKKDKIPLLSGFAGFINKEWDILR
jgi:hypothetical protein